MPFGMVGYSDAFTIEHLLESEGIILADASAQHVFMPEGLTRRVERAVNYTDIQLSEFGETLKGLAEFSRFLRFPNVYTTPKVVEEIKAWEDTIGRAFVHLNNNKDIAGRNKEVSHTSRGIPKIQQNVYSLYRLAQRLRKSAAHALINKAGSDSSEQDIKSIGYLALEMMVIAVSDIEDSKNDFSRRYQAWVERREDLRTDEQLVATALYIATVLKKPAAILTGDSDLWHIANDVLNAIACSKVPGAYTLLNAVSDNPVRIYFSNNVGRIDKKFDTSGFVKYMTDIAESMHNGRAEELSEIVRERLAELFAA